MSNLGTYQWITTIAKKVGGPIPLLVLTGVLAVAADESVKAVVKKKKNLPQKPTDMFEVFGHYQDKYGLQLNPGDKCRLLALDGDAAQIEKLEDKHNPYFISLKKLKEIAKPLNAE